MMDAAVSGKEALVSAGNLSRFRPQGLLALSLLFLAVAGATAQAPPPPAGASSSEIAVTLVEIPVEVTSRGEPVQGLTAADFEVLDGKRSLPVVAFETIDLASPPRQDAPRPPLAARRHLLFLFDFALSRPERLKEGVMAAREIVASGLDPRDLTAVGIYLPTGELHLLLSFTTDRTAASRALGALEGLLTGKEPAGGAAGSPDPLRLTGLGARSLLSQAWRVNETNFAWDALESLAGKEASDKMGSFLQQNVLSHSSGLHQPNVEARMRGHIITLSEALGGLSEILRPVSGRKYLALFSEGFALGGLTTRTATNYDRPSVGGADMLVSLRKTLGELRRSGWILHGVDITGVRQENGGDGLFFMANETGGVLVEGTNKLAEGLGGAMRRSAHSYLLSVQTDVAPDGAFHPLQVRLRDKRRGVRVVHREGYYAPLPFDRQKDVQRIAEAAILVAGEEERDELGIRIAAVPLGTGAGAGTTSVAVLVEVPGEPLLASGTPRLGVEIFGYALDEAGNSSDFFAQAVELERDKAGARLAEGGVRVLARLDLPPGAHRLRVLARDRHNGRASLKMVPLSAAAPAAASTLEAFFLPPTDDPWILVRPEDAAFDLHGRSVLPAAHATLSASGEAQLLVLGQGLAGGSAPGSRSASSTPRASRSRGEPWSSRRSRREPRASRTW